jgi:3-isopropylmalate/(R)-2-methylmalate dehydratase large subunit
MAGSSPKLKLRAMSTTLFDKVWSEHVVDSIAGGGDLIHIDRHLLHDLNGVGGFREIRRLGYRVRNPELVFATPDHAISSEPGRDTDPSAAGARYVAILREECRARGIRMFDLGHDGQGIVHVIGPELGLSLPGTTIVCGDSHTCTHGALGALAFGIGSTELVHVLATQTVMQRKPKRMRARFEGSLARGVTPKDLILHLIGRIGAAGGSGHAIEYAGSTIRGLGLEARMTICNLSIELGSKIGMIAPDDTTFEYLAGRRFAPKGAHWDQALAHWRTLGTDGDATFDREVSIDATEVAPQITWGTSPEHVIAIDDVIPDPARADDPNRREAMRAALEYMGLEPGETIAGTPINWVFIGSCTNSRISDLRAAAEVAKLGHVATGVHAWVVPGSYAVKRAAEAEGLDFIFREAGFEWREPGCSMCVAVNGDTVPPGQRAVSTSNRNFVGRQGPGARTHLASPAMAAAAALAGRIIDVRKVGA